MHVKLRFLNQSRVVRSTDVVIFQKNKIWKTQPNIVPWKVIQNCTANHYHPLEYTDELKVSIGDSWGNFSLPQVVEPNTHYEVVKLPIGRRFQKANQQFRDVRGLTIKNNLHRGAISVNVYRNGRLVAQDPVVIPGQQSFFAFDPILYIGAVSNIQEGIVHHSAVMSSVNTQLSLLGVRSTDIVMRDSDRRQSSLQPFSFSLENVGFG